MMGKGRVEERRDGRNGKERKNQKECKTNWRRRKGEDKMKVTNERGASTKTNQCYFHLPGVLLSVLQEMAHLIIRTIF